MTYKIWFQGATDRVHMAPYIAKVEAHLKAILDPEFTYTFNTTSPPATTTHALTEYRAWAHAHGPEVDAPGGGDSRAETVRRYVRGYRMILERPETTILLVAHGLPVRYILDADNGRDPAAAVAQVPYAEPFRLSSAELERAVSRLEAWVDVPTWPS